MTRTRSGDAGEGELPFVIAFLAPLGGAPSTHGELSARTWIDVSFGRLDEIIAEVAPGVTVRVDDVIAGGASLIDVRLRPRSLADLESGGLARQIPSLAPLIALRDTLDATFPAAKPASGTESGAPTQASASTSALDAVLAASESTAATTSSVDWRRELPSVLGGAVRDSRRAALILDRAIEAQVARVRATEEFQKLQSAWHGLAWLAERIAPLDKVRLRVLDVSKKEAFEDLTSAESIEDAILFRRLVGEHLLAGHDAVEPVGLIVADWEFSLHPRDTDLLHGCAWIGGAASAPFLACASPAMFGVEHFRNLPNPGDLRRHFESPSTLKWRVLRESEDARWLSLVLPRVVVSEQPRRQIAGSLVLAAALACAFHRTGFWFQACETAGDCLGDLPAEATEVEFSDLVQRTLDEQGFIPICRVAQTASPCLVTLHSAQRARRFSAQNVAASARAERLSRLPEVLFVGRFTHYLTLEATRLTRQPNHVVAEALNRWLRRWVAVPGRELDLPLTAANVDVHPLEGAPAYRAASVHLEPTRRLTPEDHASGLRFTLVLPS